MWNQHAERIWHDIMDAGQEFGLIPTGLGARDTLRLEMGYMLYGNDINDTTSTLEAGLGWITKMKKGDFIGRDFLAKQKEEGLKRKLVGFQLEGRGIPRSGYPIAVDGQEVGSVTSGSISPVMGNGIGMGYVPVEHAAVGSKLDIMIRNKPVAAEIVKTPFLKR
ncbi:MAG: glycine cleavage T C-terminal barrel domain-containing protein [Bacteroidota bacterium]